MTSHVYQCGMVLRLQAWRRKRGWCLQQHVTSRVGDVGMREREEDVPCCRHSPDQARDLRALPSLPFVAAEQSSADEWGERISGKRESFLLDHVLLACRACESKVARVCISFLLQPATSRALGVVREITPVSNRLQATSRRLLIHSAA
ncbi:hypothetical protein BAUCODRAFT_417139 [Baudoinia panamericana UAMH 10762]|uniref:Uncharacterized protein n=1 Tax=Baudoinia panamericana (strain UAMH 10762) TaxID=717646 RepID=M2NG11_BAUPA|nr:uncharacterized protein BAUCODRAFT_417139 [Baudoinia panamericana UAMH 10762]EMC98224.1 hypothetical protein BAUCODRAFT_417139 [Baudoinia panamericana UAMH 10762]